MLEFQPQFDFELPHFYRTYEHADLVDKWCEENNHTRVMTTLYGSQNYNTHFPDSDVDTKSIILPKYRQLVFEKPVSTTIHLENGEHMEVRDIRSMFDQYRKQNINFIEALYSPYANINPKFDHVYKELFTNRERIARYHPRAMVMSVCGEMCGKYARYFQNGTTEYSAKQLSNMLRMKRYVTMYLKGENVEHCLVVPNGEEVNHIRAVKKGLYPEEEMCAQAKDLAIWAHETMDWAKENLDLEPDPYVNAWLDELCYAVFVDFCEKE